MDEGPRVSVGSGHTMKEYEEQISSLRKENFNLKLNVYFLEERLYSSGDREQRDDLVKKNVQLRVDSEMMRKELDEKQELLCAAAEALQMMDREENTASASVSVSVAGSGLERLQKENLNACQMIRGCLLRIKQMDRENRRIKSALREKNQIISELREPPPYLRDSNNSGDNNEDSGLDRVDLHLRRKIDTLRESVVPVTRPPDGEANVRQMLVRRLQEMAYFLDSLLASRCIVGEEKRRKVENLLEQTMDLPLDLQIDPDVSVDALEATFGRPSHSMRLDDLTALFGHHDACRPIRPSARESSEGTDGTLPDGPPRTRRPRDRGGSVDDSESECRSGPDRTVSTGGRPRRGPEETSSDDESSDPTDELRLAKESDADASSERLRRCRKAPAESEAANERLRAEISNLGAESAVRRGSLRGRTPSPSPASDAREPPEGPDADGENTTGRDAEERAADLAENASGGGVSEGESRTDAVEGAPPTDLVEENEALRRELERTRRALDATLLRLRRSGPPQKIQRAVCLEIHKTHSLLRRVRDNLDRDC